MKKTVLVLAIAISSAHAEDWTSLLFGGGENVPQQQNTAPKQFSLADFLGGGQQQTQQTPQQQTQNFANLFGLGGNTNNQQTQQAANEAQQPGFFESFSIAMKVAQDPEVKALMEAKLQEYAHLGFFEKMSKVMNDPQLKQLMEDKASGRRPISTQQPVKQQPVTQPQAQQGGFDWSSLFGGAGQQQQAPQEPAQQGGFGQMLKNALEGLQQQPVR